MCDNLKVSGNSVEVDENSSNVVLKAVVVVDSEENGGVGSETCDLGVRKVESWTNKVLMKDKEIEINQEMQNKRGNDEMTAQNHIGSSGGLSDSVHEVVLENVMVVNQHEPDCVCGKNTKIKIDEAVNDSHVIDLKGSDDGGVCKGKSEGERVCRICHLSSDRSPEIIHGDSVNMDLIQIGCGCKEELGTAHVYCAEAWFKLKGNRVCEICGQIAKNITGLRDHSSIEAWNERRYTGLSNDSSNRRGRCWSGQPFCNFLMACLVIAFVLPWFFHMDVF